MPIEYIVTSNYLTSPPSYSARVQPQRVLGYDQIARLINLHNPTIPEDTARAVLEAFREEVLTQAAAGNTTKLENFVSFVTTLPVRMENATDPLPEDSLDLKAKPAKPFKDALKEMASFIRVGYEDKQPSIVAAFDTNLNARNIYRAGFGFQIEGQNIGFDPLDSELGVTLTYAIDDETVPQTNVSLNDPSKLIVIPEAHDFSADPSQVEAVLKVNCRYTENGQVKTGTYSRKVRGVNAITDEGPTFVIGTDVPTCSLAAVPVVEAGQLAMLVAYLRPTGELQVYIQEVDGNTFLDPGPEVLITEADTYVLSGLTAGDIDFVVSDFDGFRNAVLSYNRYINEMVALTQGA